MRHPNHLPSGDVAWPKLRLLVFSTDDQIRFLVRSTFRRLNIREVLSTAEPADAPVLMKLGADILLLDLGSPEKGLAVLEDLRKPDNPFRDLPVLVLVGSDEKALINQARTLGIEGVLPKPVSGHELVHRIGETLKNPERMAPPDRPAERPRIEFAKDTARLPEAPPPVPIPKGVFKPVAAEPPGPPKVAELSFRPRSGVGGGVPARPSRRPDGGGIEGGDLPAPPARLSEDDLAPAPARPSGGRLGDDDIAPSIPQDAPPVPQAGPGEPPRRPARPRLLDDAEARALAEKRKARWQEALAEAGHQPRTGEDVAGLDVSAVVAEHVAWLRTKGADGKRASFEGMDLAGADLAGRVLANATFRACELSDSRLAEARLDGADLRHAVLSASDLAGANLGVASLRHANLRLANLEGASLRGADLSGAILSGARTNGADFSGATLMGADLRQLDLSMASNLTQAQVDKAMCDMSTRLPAGVFRPVRDRVE